MKLFKSSLISLALALGAVSVGAQTVQPVNLSSNNVPSLSTNNVPGTAIQNGYISRQDLYYNYLSYSTNGTATLIVQQSPDGNLWAQVPPSYLAAGTTNQINITQTSNPSPIGKYTNTYSGMVTIDTSHGQFFRISQEINTGLSSGGGPGYDTLTVTNYSQH